MTPPIQTKTMVISPWIIWGLGALFVLFQFLVQSSTSVMIPCLMKAFHIDSTGVGVLSSSFFYTYIVLQVPAGMLIDRFGVRKTLTIGALLIAIACVVFAKTHNIHIAEASRMLMGVAAAPGVAAAMYLAATRFPLERFCFVAGLTEMMGMFGGAVGEIYLAQCVGHFGWRNTMLSCVGIALVLAILIWFIMRETPRNYPHQANNEVCEPLFIRMKCVLASAQVWLNGMFAGLSFALIAAFASLWCVPFLQAAYHISLTRAAFGSAMIFVGAAFGSPAWGWLAGRAFSRRGLMTIGTICCIGAMLVMLYVPTPLWLTDSLLLLIGATASVYVIPFALVQEQTPMACKGAAMGFTNMLCIAIGAPILQPMIGYLLQLSSPYHGWVSPSHLPLSDYQHALMVLPIALVLGLLILVFIRDPRRKTNEACC